ncbi:MAG: glycine cleavage system H protein [bacterium]|nr:MAG: glycine cleavage system H protein [bacterium]
MKGKIMECPEGLRYTKEHEWTREEENIVTIGITDYAQGELGDVVYVELPDEGMAVNAGEPFGVVESVKSVSDLYSPISGTVVEANARLNDEPEVVNGSPYNDGWLMKVECADKSELDKLMTADEYMEFVKSLG